MNISSDSWSHQGSVFLYPWVSGLPWLRKPYCTPYNKERIFMKVNTVAGSMLILFLLIFLQEKCSLIHSVPWNDTYRQARTLMGMGWWVDAEVKAVFRHRDRRWSQIQQGHDQSIYFVSFLKTPGNNGSYSRNCTLLKLDPRLAAKYIHTPHSLMSGSPWSFSKVPSHQFKYQPLGKLRSSPALQKDSMVLRALNPTLHEDRKLWLSILCGSHWMQVTVTASSLSIQACI